MKVTISSTEVVRTFGDCLARIKHCGDVFVITKGRESVAELMPAPGSRRGTWGEILAALKRLPEEPGFADDLEKVNEADQVFENPWD